MVDFVEWLVMTIVFWRIAMIMLSIEHSSLILNNSFFFGTLIIWGVIVFIIHTLIEYYVYKDTLVSEEVIK